MVPVAQETTANTVRLPYSFSRRFSLVAWCEASLEILHVHPLSLSVLQELQRGLNAPFTLRQIDEAEFEQRLNAVWQRDSSEARQLMEDLGSAEDFFTLAEELPETEDLLESDDDAPIIKLINAMLAEAIKEGASDIHIETFEKSLVIRFRVDGTLHEMLRPGRKLASLLVSRIKVMARLDIAEKRVPQDGRIALLLGGRAIDVRVSTMPSAWGERVVVNPLMRLPRSNLLTVGYRIHDGYLERLAWPLTDAAGSVKPTMQKLIPADSLRLQFYDGTRWQESWSSVQAIPVAVRMTLHSPQWGEIERIWLLRGPQ